MLEGEESGVEYVHNVPGGSLLPRPRCVVLRGKNIEDDKVDGGFDDVEAGRDEDDEIECDVEAVDKKRQDNAASAKA